MSTPTTAVDRTTELERKIDALTEQVAFLSDEARMQRQRRERWDELRSDMTPLAGRAVEKVTAEFERIDGSIDVGHMIELLERVARNAPALTATLDQLAALHELVGDLAPLSTGLLDSATDRMADLDRRGYFSFAREGGRVLDRVVTSFGEDDVRQLGDNIVLILQVVKEMTQPEVMKMLQRTAEAAKEDTTTEVTFRQIIRELRDPQVKLGLHRMLNVLNSMGGMDQPDTITQINNPKHDP